MPHAENDNSALVVASLGEALYDCFAAHATLGGAPVNLAARLQQLLTLDGGACVLVSRVGSDRLGEQLIADLQDCELGTAHVQVDGVRPSSSDLTQQNSRRTR
jgi:fructokinase